MGATKKKMESLSTEIASKQQHAMKLEKEVVRLNNQLTKWKTQINQDKEIKDLQRQEIAALTKWKNNAGKALAEYKRMKQEKKDKEMEKEKRKSNTNRDLMEVSKTPEVPSSISVSPQVMVSKERPKAPEPIQVSPWNEFDDKPHSNTTTLSINAPSIKLGQKRKRSQLEEDDDQTGADNDDDDGGNGDCNENENGTTDNRKGHSLEPPSKRQK